MDEIVKFLWGRSRLAVAAAVAILVALPGPANAVLLNYSFSGTASGSLTVGGVTMAIAPGTSFTVSGMTLSDTEAGAFASPDGIGQFPAMSTYDFGGLGSFTTDATSGEFFIQAPICGPDFSCVFVANSDLTAGLQINFDPVVTSIDPDSGGIPFGDLSIIESFAGPRIIFNSAGDSIFFDDLTVITSGSVTAKIPEPGAALLLGIGLAGLGIARRRQTAA